MKIDLGEAEKKEGGGKKKHSFHRGGEVFTMRPSSRGFTRAHVYVRVYVHARARVSPDERSRFMPPFAGVYLGMAARFRG